MDAHNQREPNPIDEFLPEIFEREAKGYLTDALTIPAVVMRSFALDEAQSLAAVAFVANVFREVYQQGGLKVAGLVQDRTLYGYALVFAQPNAPHLPVYLHKIFVMEQYRGQGLGRQMMESMMDAFGAIALLCPPDKVGFYKRLGFVAMEYDRPQDANFRLSQHLYSDLVLMTNNIEAGMAPFFLLNDNDLYGALGMSSWR